MLIPFRVKRYARSIFSKGVMRASETLGKEGVHVGGMELPAYDPRGAKGIALAYITSNRGGCHLQACTISPERSMLIHAKRKGKAAIVKRMYDPAIICKFHGYALFKTLDFELDRIADAPSTLTSFRWTNSSLHEEKA